MTAWKVEPAMTRSRGIPAMIFSSVAAATISSTAAAERIPPYLTEISPNSQSQIWVAVKYSCAVPMVLTLYPMLKVSHSATEPLA